MLWSINTTPNRSTGYTPFFMVYGAEAVPPSDIRHDSPRVAAYIEADNEQARHDALDLLDKHRDLVAARSAIYQQDLHTNTNNFVPNEYREVVNPSGLVVYKGSNGCTQAIPTLGRVLCGQQEFAQWFILPH